MGVAPRVRVLALLLRPASPPERDGSGAVTGTGYPAAEGGGGGIRAVRGKHTRSQTGPETALLEGMKTTSTSPPKGRRSPDESITTPEGLLGLRGSFVAGVAEVVIRTAAGERRGTGFSIEEAMRDAVKQGVR